MELKLKELHVKNYKLFKDLEIPKLGQVNLITGKNNTGKTILLEALRIWASEGDASVINNIIWTRGDWDDSSELKTYSSLFTDSMIEKKVEIEQLQIVSVLTRDKKYLDDLRAIIMDEQTAVLSALREYKSGEENEAKVLKDKGTEIRMRFGTKEHPQDVAIFVPASIDFDNKKLWSNIDLTDKKDIVIQILQIIEPSIIDLGIIDNVARVRTKDSKIPVPLKNFGEGLNRLLTIAMALVSAEDNLLLIDEIDTGLHHSVLEKLWEVIFTYADELKTQVFVTTHSWDCISAFSYVYNKNEKNKAMGNYFRLRRSREDAAIIEPVYYTNEELEDALMSNIETR
ncbi:MAG: AAA family ATPase [Saprospiraceae bacterium]|nr:AAA family ATPase [Saprospiraceae bacterium]